MKDVFKGWSEIAGYLELHLRTAQRYAQTHGMPVHRRPGGGPKAPVFALKSELDAWAYRSKNSDGSAIHAPETTEMVPRSAELAVPVLDLISKVALDTKLYRRNYVLRFDLQRSVRGTQARVECEFELCNATGEGQPYVQEVTVDECDHGYVERMSFAINGKPAYILKKPALVEKLIGYSVYHGPEQMLEPSTRGLTYWYHAAWVINRGEDEIWYNHMVLPTVGVEVETHAPPEFRITPSFSTSNLLLTGAHVDIAWDRRR